MITFNTPIADYRLYPFVSPVPWGWRDVVFAVLVILPVILIVVIGLAWIEVCDRRTLTRR